MECGYFWRPAITGEKYEGLQRKLKYQVVKIAVAKLAGKSGLLFPLTAKAVIRAVLKVRDHSPRQNILPHFLRLNHDASSLGGEGVVRTRPPS